MKNFAWLLLLAALSAKAQTDSAQMNLDAVYGRPLRSLGVAGASLGGYVEANMAYSETDGIAEGLAFQIPRATLFISSQIAPRIRFLTELELEEGGQKLSIEFASLDATFHPLLNLRTGIVLNPIGSFNQNHDGPKWEFVDRPLVSTTVLPSTWSTVGAGLFGKSARGQWSWAYEAYASNGFDQSIIENETGRTNLAAAKANADRFEENLAGMPLITAKTAIKHRRFGELGLSWMGGQFTKPKTDGLAVSPALRADAFAVDYNFSFGRWGPTVVGEAALVMVEVPITQATEFGSRQAGFFTDLVQPLVRQPILGWEKAALFAALRAEWVNYYAGALRQYADGDPTSAGLESWSLSAALSFRPTPTSVMRLCLVRRAETDLFKNLPTPTAAVQWGVSSYF